MSAPLSSEERFAVPDWVAVTVTDDAGMLLDLRGKGTWYLLPSAAVAAWIPLAQGNTVHATALVLATRFSLLPQRAEADVVSFACSLLGLGLLAPVPAMARNRKAVRR
jgi:hypothetical protein